PFGNLEDEPPPAHAKEAASSGDGAKKDDAKKDDAKKDDAKKDDATPKNDEKAEEGNKDPAKPDGGGPRADGQDVPGGGRAPAQAARKPAPAPQAKPGDDKTAPDAGKKPADKTEPAKPFEYLKQSTAPGKIVVIGSADFASDPTLQGSLENAVLVQNAAGYMASDGLTGLRAKRLSDRPFEPPNDTPRAVATMLGWFATPVLLLVLLVVVHTLR